MKDTIQFFHPEETLTYHLDKSFCKVVFLKQKNCLVLEIESTEDLDHLEEDSLQNEYPKVILNIDDYPIPYEDREQLIGNTIEIPEGTGEIENRIGELEDIYYTNLSVKEGDFELNKNIVSFKKDENGDLHVHWTGETEDFTEVTDDPITFEVNCSLKTKNLEIIE